MKCDELKAFNMPRYAGEFTMHEVYSKSDVDAAIAERKQKLEDAKATAYAESVDAGMRERKLKAFNMPRYAGEFTIHEVYLKSEADKVIEEKDAEIARLKAIRKVHVEAIESMGAGLLQDEEENRHANYKRCLAMAVWCEATALWCYQAANTLPKGFKATLFGKPVMIEPDRLYNRFERLMKWNNRWLKIAEQFKEAK